MIDYSLRGQPMERATGGGITIREIEAEVAGLYRDTLSAMQVREKAFLFALLKQGASIQKLQWFTGYEIDFIRERVEALRAAGRLITNTPSTQYLQNQVAGCEALIERITGQRVVPMTNAAAPRLAIVVAESNPKEESMHESTQVNGAANIEDFQQTCAKTHDCARKAGHTGMCTGTKLKTRRLSADSPEQQRAANAARMKVARAKNKSYGRGTKAATPDARVFGKAKASPAPAPVAVKSAKADPGHFVIQFEDETETISIEGMGRDTFKRKLKALYEEFAGE
jgi:hypothetical protein